MGDFYRAVFIQLNAARLSAIILLLLPLDNRTLPRHNVQAAGMKGSCPCP